MSDTQRYWSQHELHLFGVLFLPLFLSYVEFSGTPPKICMHMFALDYISIFIIFFIFVLGLPISFRVTSLALRKIKITTVPAKQPRTYK